ncbi:MAG TPA: BON domain-containing protein [Chloroflexota bacterium]|nr:BON domain-containing protein [Chloroflexota bacterium]
MNYGMGPNFGCGPQCGCQPNYYPAMNWGGGYGFTPPANAWMGPAAMGWGLGGARTWGGTYTPQFLTTGLPTDNEIVEMVYDSMDDDPVIPFDADITVDSNAGTVTLTGTVHSKLVKHAAGDDAWWIPGVDDVRNQLQVMAMRPGPMSTTTRGETSRRPATTPTTPRATATPSARPTSRTTTTGTTKGTGTTSRPTATGTTGKPRAASTGTTSRKPATGTAGTSRATGTGAISRTTPTAAKEKTTANARGTTGTPSTGTRSAAGTRKTSAM